MAWWGPWLAYWTIKFLGRTMRFEEINPDSWNRKKPAIGVFWHGRLLMMPLIYKGKNLSFLVSSHRDGQVVGKALTRFGFHAILGSTTRKGFSGFKQMLKALRNGSDLAITPDGPRGPRCRVQMGVIELAKLTGRAVIPLSFSSSRRKILKTWDHFLLPYPFSRGVFVWGEPVSVDPNGDRTHLEERRALLEKRLNELTEEADHYFDLR
ncbi:MAG: lysophospholipid acyltransferase family protein [Thermodesulfobacteriota bacterium]